MDGRDVRALIIVGVAAALLVITNGPGADAFPPAEARVVIEGPDGRMASGNVTADPGTAFHALQAAAAQANLSVEWSGRDGARFVHTVGAVSSPPGGWCAQVDGVDAHRSTDRIRVPEGSLVRWYWTADQCERF